jgi:tRNA1(Val) A37 N6-methylase TrmN6
LLYDLVIGNPPYGEHRGLYKGLGEEPKISKYEDYFVKRSLDSLRADGILAMVLPSGWLNRQKNLQNADMVKVFVCQTVLLQELKSEQILLFSKKTIRKFLQIFPIILKLILQEF